MLSSFVRLLCSGLALLRNGYCLKCALKRLITALDVCPVEFISECFPLAGCRVLSIRLLNFCCYLDLICSLKKMLALVSARRCWVPECRVACSVPEGNESSLN